MRYRPTARRALLGGLCLLLLPACDSDGGAAGPPPGDPPPAALVGTWTSVVNTSPIDFYNPDTGAWSEPSFFGTALMFFDDSTYLLGDSWTVSAYGCTYKLAQTQKGFASVEGDLLHLSPNDGEWWTEHSCGSNDEGDETLVPTTYRFSQLGHFVLELWDTSLPDPDPAKAKGLIGAPCTEGSDCLGGWCIDAGGYLACSGHCSDAVGCMYLEKRDLGCADLYECRLSCNPGGDGNLYSFGDVQLCSDDCWARATPAAHTGYNAIADCAWQSGCADEACFLDACAQPLDTCTH